MFGTHGSGTGGTGFIGVQLAKALGAGTVITSTSGAADIAFAKSLGADRVFDYKVLDIFAPGALPDNSVDVVYLPNISLDPACPATFPIKTHMPGSRYDNYGAAGTADKAMSKIKPGGVCELFNFLKKPSACNLLPALDN